MGSGLALEHLNALYLDEDAVQQFESELDRVCAPRMNAGGTDAHKTHAPTYRHAV